MPPPVPALGRLEPLAEGDFAAVAALGDEIWRTHYVNLISLQQVEYMLAGRYSPERLRTYLGAPDRWMRVLRVEGRPVGYCSYALTGTAREMKLEQLYLLAELRGQRLGGQMLRHVEAEARAHRCAALILSVNKGNVDSIAIYKRAGFTVREEVTFAIGEGWVMDDFVMEKRL